MLWAAGLQARQREAAAQTSSALKMYPPASKCLLVGIFVCGHCGEIGFLAICSLRAWFLKRICNFCLNASKNLWICLISSKNLCPKYRIFALFRLAFQAHFSGGTLKRARDCPSKEPDFLAMTERFAGKVHQVWAICRFFSSCLSKFTQTWCSFQAQKFRAT